MKCSECKWWGRSLVDASFTQPNKNRAICDDPDSPSCYRFYVPSGGRVGWDVPVEFWTYEDFYCKDFKPKEKS